TLQSGDQNDADVHDVCLRQARLEKRAGRLEEVVGVVALQAMFRAKAELFRDVAGERVGECPRGVCGAVLAVAAAAQNNRAAQPLPPQLSQHGQGEFLVASALAVWLRQGDGRFPATEQTGR